MSIDQGNQKVNLFGSGYAGLGIRKMKGASFPYPYPIISSDLISMLPIPLPSATVFLALEYGIHPILENDPPGVRSAHKIRIDVLFHRQKTDELS